MYNQPPNPTQGTPPLKPAGPSQPGPAKPSGTGTQQDVPRPTAQQLIDKEKPVQMKKGGKSGILVTIILIVFILAAISGGYLLLKSGRLSPRTTTITTTVQQYSVSSINGCTSVSRAGKYYLQSNIKTSISNGACLNITSSNVAIICNNHRIAGSGPFVDVPPFTYGIGIGRVSNVTIQGCGVSNFSYGIYAFMPTGLIVKGNNLSMNYMSNLALNATGGSVVENNYMSKSSSGQGSLYLTNGTSGATVYNNTIQYDLVAGIGVNASGNNFEKNFINGTPSSFYCSAPNGFVMSNNASSNLCYNSTGCGFAQCRGANIPANLSRINLESSVSGCGTISSPGSYSLSSDVSMNRYVNTSDILALTVSCISIKAKNVIFNCNGFGIYNSTVAINIASTYNVTVEGCKVRNALSGIILYNASLVKVSNSSVGSGLFGIILQNTSVSSISSTRVSNEVSGIMVNGSYSNIFQNVTSRYGTYGVFLSSKSFSNTFNRDTITNNTEFDVYATPDSANASYDLMQSTTCGTTNTKWATCSRYIETQLPYQPIQGCMSISIPGNYLLTRNIDNAYSNCMSIKVSNVHLSCGGHIITGQSSASYGISVSGIRNVTVDDCGVAGFGYGSVRAVNSSAVAMSGISVFGSRYGITYGNVNGGSLYNSLVNGTVNASIYLYNSIGVSVTHSNTTYGQQSNIAILISNSTHDIISNVTGSRNRIGMDLAGNSLNNTIFNNTMQLSTGVDYMCNGNSGIGDENGGINYGTTKSGCRWLAAITVTSPSPHCGVALQSSLFNLYSDAQYTAGSTCFSAYSNITTINCNGHTVIATNGGTFALFRNAQKSTMENCFLKGFKTAISSQNSTMTVINNTIMGMPGNSSGIIINGARLGATVQANNVSGTATAISVSGIGYNGKIINNNVLSSGTAYYISNVTSAEIYNNTASSDTLNGIVLNDSRFNSFTKNRFMSSVNGMECIASSEAHSNNSDLGLNSCSLNLNCFWITGSASSCP